MQREGLNLGFVRPEDFRMDTSLGYACKNIIQAKVDC